MGHLFSLLGRLPKAKNPKKELNACFDALMTMLEAHYTAAACQILEIDNPEEEPASLSKVKKHSSVEEKKKYITNVAEEIVKKYTIIEEALVNKKVSEQNDHINNYARIFCHFGSLVYEFTNAWREGDGERIIRCWGVFLLHFHADRRTKYAHEALRLKLNLALLSPKVVHELTWNRFVNTHGGQGRNLPCDLHNEHINKLIKEIISSMGANLKGDALSRAARSVTFLASIRERFDKEVDVPVISSAHKTKSNSEDIQTAVSVLLSEKVFAVKPGRKHSGFRRISANPLHHLKWKDMEKWIKSKHSKQAKKIKPSKSTDTHKNTEETASETESESEQETEQDSEQESELESEQETDLDSEENALYF